MAASDQLTLQQVLEWRDVLLGEWMQGDNLDRAQEEEEGLYFQRFEVLSPGGKMAVRTGSAPSDADAAIDSIVPEDIQVRCRPARKTEAYERQAELLSRFGRALVRQWRQHRDVLARIAADQVIRRVGVARVLFDDTLWPPRPADLDADDALAWEVRHRRRCPIVLQHRNPRYVRWRETDSGELLAVVEHYRTTKVEALVAWGHLPEARRVLRGRPPNELVTISDVWVGRYRSVLLDDQPIFPGRGEMRGVMPHGYACIPYLIAPFRELPFEDPARRYRGMLTNAAGLYPIESNVLTMQVWMLMWNAWRTWIGWTRDGRDLEIVPGQYIPIAHHMNEYLQMLQGEPVPPELLQTAAVMDAYIQRNGVAQGPRTREGTRSAQQVWAIQAIRQLKIESARKALERLVERALALALMEIELLLREPLVLPLPGRDREGKYLGEVSVGPKDIRGYWDGWDVTFGKRMDPALLEQAKALMALAQNNWMPLEVSWELSGLAEVPGDWEDKLYLQAIDRLPFMLEAAGLERLKNYYGEDHPLYQLFLQKVMASRSAPPGGAPGVPASGGIGTPPGMHGPTAPPPVGPRGPAAPPAPPRAVAVPREPTYPPAGGEELTGV